MDSISRLRDNAFLVRRTQTARPFRVFWLDRFVRCARKNKKENLRFWTKIRDFAGDFFFQNRRFCIECSCNPRDAPRASRGAQWRVLSGSKTRHITRAAFFETSKIDITLHLLNPKWKKTWKRRPGKSTAPISKLQQKWSNAFGFFNFL